jgi:hypothetical protein
MIPHEQRLDHLEAGDDQGDRQDEGDGPMRRQPAEILTQASRRFGGAAAPGLSRPESPAAPVSSSRRCR